MIMIEKVIFWHLVDNNSVVKIVNLKVSQFYKRLKCKSNRYYSI